MGPRSPSLGHLWLDENTLTSRSASPTPGWRSSSLSTTSREYDADADELNPWILWRLGLLDLRGDDGPRADDGNGSDGSSRTSAVERRGGPTIGRPVPDAGDSRLSCSAGEPARAERASRCYGLVRHHESADTAAVSGSGLARRNSASPSWSRRWPAIPRWSATIVGAHERGDLEAGASDRRIHLPRRPCT